jgi:amino acid adenylation domain-containing protein
VSHYSEQLSPTQKSIWIKQNLYPQSAIFNVGGYVELKGDLDADLLIKAFLLRLKAIDVFELTSELFSAADSEFPPYKCFSFDFSEPLNDSKNCLEWMERDIKETIDYNSCLLYVTILKASSKHHFLYFKAHHIVIDGFSFELLIGQASKIYKDLLKSQMSDLSWEAFRYSDFIIENRAYEGSPAYLKDKEFWINKLKIAQWGQGFESIIESGQTPDFLAQRKQVSLFRRDFEQIARLCETHSCSVFHYFIAVILVLNKKYGNSSCMLGLPVFNRSNRKFKSTIGVFINVVPFYIDFSAAESFRNLLQRVKKEIREIYRHQRFPIHDLHDELDLNSNYYNLLFSYQKINYEDNLYATDSKSVYLNSGEQEEDLVIHLLEYSASEDLTLAFDFKVNLFSEKIISDLMLDFQDLLLCFLGTPDQIISEAKLVSIKEAELLIGMQERQPVTPSFDTTFIELFSAQCLVSPNSIAVVFEDRSMTYRELDELSNRFGHYILETYSVQRDDLIGLCLDRSEWLFVCLLGVLKAGAAYVPIDPEYPAERILYMQQNSGCLGVIDSVALDTFRKDQNRYSSGSLDRTIRGSDLAYVIYTSGSTGHPKGVMVEHHSLVNIGLSWRAHYKLDTFPVRLLQLASFSFDVFAGDYLRVFLHGGTLILCPAEMRLEVKSLYDILIFHRISIFESTPGLVFPLFEHLSQQGHRLPDLRLLILGSDVVNGAGFNRLLENVPAGLRVVNSYGLTECTIDSSYFEPTPGYRAQGPVPIGKAFDHTNLYVLDEHQGLLPAGVRGELCISGAGLARGYLHNPELTSMKFIAHPFVEGERLYCTGDLVRRLPSGDLEFIGRKDDQVKIRGYRIELGEIENVLLGFARVEGVKVVSRKVGSGENELVAYLVSSSDLNVAELRKYLEGKLPSYMHPGYYVQLGELPLTANGKIDVKALPNPENHGLSSGIEFIAPESEGEKHLAAIWELILNRTGVGKKDNFFTLGGHSLKATRLLNLIRKEFGIRVELKDLFLNPILEDQAALLLKSRTQSYIPISRVSASPDGLYELSSSQKRLWVLSQFEQGRVAYNIPGLFELNGELDIDALEQSFQKLIDRHEILRTCFVENGESVPMQSILREEEVHFKLASSDLRNSTNQEEQLKQAIREDQQISFDLTKGPLIRASLFHLGEHKWVFSFVIHHLISDGWSTGILVNEISVLYNSLVRKKETELPPLKLQYKDYSSWQQAQLLSKDMEEAKIYWLKQFAGSLPVLEMSGDYRRPSIKTYSGGSVTRKIDSGIIRKIKQSAKELDATLYMSLLAGVYALLYRYTGQSDIILGTPVAGRTHSDLEDQIGLYVNTLALRTRFKGEYSYIELLRAVHEVTLNAFAYECYPFDLLVDELQLSMDMSRNALFDVMVILHNNDGNQIQARAMEGIQLSPHPGFDKQTGLFDLDFDFREVGEDLHLTLKYNGDIYKEQSVVRLAHHFERLLDAMVSSPLTALSSLEYLSESDKQQQLQSLNRSGVNYPQHKTIIDLFEEQSLLAPDSVAIRFEGIELTYTELNEVSNKLGAYLAESSSIGANDLVGIRLDRSEWMIIAMLGILKSGGAYVPIDPNYPQERIDYMIEDSRCKAVVDLEYLGRFVKEQGSLNKNNPERRPHSSDLAYVIYTSGTTGKPKGTLIEHRNVVRLFVTDEPLFDFNSGDVWTLFHSYCFDFSVWEIYGALLFGGTLVVVPSLTAKDPQLFTELMIDEGVTVLNQTPSSFYQVISAETGNRPLSLRYVIFGGESLSPGKLKEWKGRNPKTKLINMYGITETTVHVTFKELSDEDISDNSGNIGLPIPTLSCYVLDNHQNLLPLGAAGELYVGGAGVARGYLNREELTAEKFILSPFYEGEILYKSGDRVRLLESGELEYHGRIDDQVKIRGYRIELGEIENVLQGHDSVESVVVLPVSRESGEKELVAYLVSPLQLNLTQLRQFLDQHLPSYMHPAYFVQLDQLSLTTNGKIDKKALPSPFGLGIESGRAYRAPHTIYELKLSQIWSDLLGRTEIGVEDNFFALGGHSLKVTRLLSRIQKEFNVKIALKDLFLHAVLEDQARLIGSSHTSLYHSISPAPVQMDGLYELSSAQSRLWVLSQFEQGSEAYHMPGIYEFEGVVDVQALESSFRKLIARHEILRTSFLTDGDGNPKQFIVGENDFTFKLGVVNLSARKDLEGELKGMIVEDQKKAFDFVQGPLLRAGLYRMSEHRWVLSYVMHHLISDGWSMGLLIKEVQYYYNGLVKGESVVLPPLKLQYKDYSFWQQKGLEATENNNSRNYWMKEFAGEVPVLEIPSDHLRPSVKTYRGSSLTFQLNGSTVETLKEFVQSQGATLFMGLLSGVYALLYRYTNQEDIVIGSPVAGRDHGDLEGQLGLYLNTLALRTRFNGSDSYKELLARVRGVTLEGFAHQSYPFDALVEELRLQRDMSRNALFDVMVVLQNTEGNEALEDGMEGLRLKPYTGYETETGLFDLDFEFEEVGEGLCLTLEYNTDLFEKSSILQIGNHFESLLTALIISPHLPLSSLSFLSDEEKNQELQVSTKPVTPSFDTTFIELFSAQCLVSPNSIAVVFEDRSMTYRELDELSNRFGHYILETYSVQRDDLIGLCLDRSEWLFVCLLGVLKAGAAYVPIDPEYPAERILYMQQNSGCLGVIDSVALDTFRKDQNRYSSGSLDRTIRGSDLAYVIYTSGSTGHPKGVMVEHHSLVNIGLSWRAHYKLDTFPVRLLQLASFSFDVFAGDYLRVFLHGGTLILCPAEMRLEVKSLYDILIFHRISIFESTPGLVFPLFEHLSQQGHRLPDLRLLILGSDVVNGAGFNRLLENVPAGLRVVNSYGLTECTIDSSYFEPTPGYRAQGPVPIGKAFDHTNLYVLDEHQGLLPAGVRGELCISGAGLARGYLHNPELTSMKFIAHPFVEGERLYCTGDLVRRLPSGDLEFIGRKDDQVKIRGYRIELGEIENVLLGFARVEGVKVVSRKVGSGENELVAYLVSSSDLNVAELRKYLEGKLPSYMHPGYYVQLGELPLTANGKIDVKALPNPENHGLSSGIEFIAPESETEIKLSQIWSDLLGRTEIGMRDNFFALGGHSLKATRLLSRIQKEFEVKLSLKDLFQFSVLEDQVRLIGRSHTARFKTITKAPLQLDGLYELSSAQSRLWVLSQFVQGSEAYHMTGLYEFEGAVDELALESSFRKLIARHEILRTIFREDKEGNPKQFIVGENDFSFKLGVVDLRDQIDQSQELEKLIGKEHQVGFDLKHGPLLRAVLYRMSEHRWVFSYVMHHLISDGWSMGLLIKEIQQSYNAIVRGESITPAPLDLQYKDYSFWQQRGLEGSETNTSRLYWMNQFEDSVPVLEMPSDRVRPSVKTFNGSSVKFQLNRSTVETLKEFVQSQGATLFMGLLSGVYALLYRYTNQEDIVIGSPVAGRDHGDLEGQLGLYLNTLALRTRFNGSDSYKELLARVRGVTLEGFAHQSYPFDALVEELRLQRDMSRNALFDVMVVLQNTEGNEAPEDGMEGLRLRPYTGYEKETGLFDLDFEFEEEGDELYLSLEFNSDIFDTLAMKRAVTHFDQLLQMMVSNPAEAISRIDYLDKSEKDLLRSFYQLAPVAEPKSTTFVHLAEAQCKQTPDQIAVVDEGREITYRELHEEANRFARFLLNNFQVRPNELVGVMLEKSERLIVSILGILKSGAAYVPIDPDYPEERIQFMVTDSKCRLVIDQEMWSLYLSERSTHSPGFLENNCQPGDLAYVIYTSGSTGEPKGVMVEHKSLVSIQESWKKAYELDAFEIALLQLASVSFDVFAGDLCRSLLNGGRMILCTNRMKLDVEQLYHLLQDNEITILEGTPGLIAPLLEYISAIPDHVNYLKMLILGSDTVSPALFERIRKQVPGVRVVNSYGTTETTIDSTYFEVEGSELLSPDLFTTPIGKPFSNTSIYILDREKHLHPIGISGEIYIGGYGLARGYLHNLELTARKFIPDPFRPGERMYKTGDHGRWLSDGNIEFLGRQDDQVKIRGFRIELGEIEHALLSNERILNAVVLAKQDMTGEKCLVAYAESHDELTTNQIQDYLADKLPLYMIPAYCVVVEKFPVTLNGKIDKIKLLSLDNSEADRRSKYEAPTTKTEELLVSLWEGILGVENVGVRDNFFELGGHSLKAVRLKSKIQTLFDIEVDMATVFQYPEIFALAKYIDVVVSNNVISVEESENADVLMI